jgi:Mrp family chromosome partitioning ATPase/capsular polysaccharide biosynthesis protein
MPEPIIGGRLARNAMELEYVAKAVRRFWPVVLLCALVGVIAGQVLQPSSQSRYASTALLLVVPSTASGVGGGTGDRYVASQLVVLESPPLAARAAELSGVPLADGSAAHEVSFIQIPGTDVVRVVASSTSPANSQAIANAFVDAYIERTDTGSGADETLGATEIETSLSEIELQLAELDSHIGEAMAPFVQTSEDDPDVEIPTVEQVAPALATEREVLLETYRGLLSQRTQLEFEPPAETGSQVIQRAQRPTAPVGGSSRVMTLALPILGLLVGVGIATVLARASRRVVDAAEVTEILGVPFAATIPGERALRARSLFQLEQLPDEYDDAVSELCVQAEAKGKLDMPLTVLVTGSQRVAGSTTLAAAMAVRFGALGSTVALVDLDFEQPDLSKCFGVEGDGIARLVEGTTAMTTTPLANVSVVGRRPGLPQPRAQRSELLFALDAAAEHADVVVVDAGSMFSAPAAAVLAQHTDVIVLAVPVWSQERASLKVVARQLASVKAHILPVAMPRLKRSDRLPLGAEPAVDVDAVAFESLPVHVR